jgi:predicted membrane protein
MKKLYLVDLIYIIVLAGVLVMISEMGLSVKLEYLFIPFLVCYYIGRYVSHFINKAK